MLSKLYSSDKNPNTARFSYTMSLISCNGFAFLPITGTLAVGAGAALVVEEAFGTRYVIERVDIAGQS